MDGRERVFDNIFVEQLWCNVKHKDVYLKGYASMGELITELAEYFIFYNGERSHQSLGQKTPDVVYQIGTGGEVVIMNKYPRAIGETPVPPIVVPRSEITAKAKSGQRRPTVNEIERAT